MTIAELARHSGVGVETVRYYQRLGLLCVPPVRGHGHRCYGHAAMAELRFVRRCKGLGFSLKQIAVLAQLQRTRRGSCSRLHHQLGELSTHLEITRERLDGQEKVVRSLVTSCAGGKPIDECGALARLERDARLNGEGDETLQ